jgi:hypothetical protein
MSFNVDSKIYKNAAAKKGTLKMNSSHFSRMVRSLAVVAFCLAANTSFAELISIDSKVLQLLPRDWGLSVRIEPIAAQELQTKGVSCADNSLPVIELNKPSYKTSKDALLLAYAMKKKVRFYIERVATSAPEGAVCLGGFAPKIYAIDVSDF